MIDGIPNRPLYFYQKDVIGCNLANTTNRGLWESRFWLRPTIGGPGWVRGESLDHWLFAKDMRYVIFCEFMWKTLHIFSLIIELLLSTFMIMINIVKIELTNATKNCLLNIFTVLNLFHQLSYSLFIPFSYGQN